MAYLYNHSFSGNLVTIKNLGNAENCIERCVKNVGCKRGTNWSNYVRFLAFEFYYVVRLLNSHIYS